jgi:pimeloyl-ACP methyl ester carboxylesterase
MNTPPGAHAPAAGRPRQPTDPPWCWEFAGLESFKVATGYVIALAMMISAVAASSAQGAPRTEIVEDGAIQIEIFLYGDGPETLIMSAGNGRPATDLKGLAEHIASSGYRVITYNYRGIGKSTGPLSGITLHDFARDVWRIADALAVERVHLAGKTYGNRVMRAASADEPKRVLSLILIGAGGEILPSPEVQAKYRRYIDPGISQEEWLRLHGELNFAPGNQHHAKLSAEYGKYPELAKAQVKARERTPKNEWLGAGTAPMLVLTGLQDIVAVPENGLNIEKERPNSWLVGIPNCGHNMVFEQPDAITKLIVAFLDRSWVLPDIEKAK